MSARAGAGGSAAGECPLGICDGSGFVIDEQSNTATDCRCRAQRILRARAHSLSGVIPKRFRGVGFERPPVTEIDTNVVREVRRFVQEIDKQLDEGRGLWFMGDVGTGKTTLAMIVAKAALDAGRTVAIYSLPRLLAQIRTTFDDAGGAGGYLPFVDRLSRVDLLHIDDVGAEKTSPWVLEQLYSIVNSRYEDRRSVMITTNLDHEDLTEQIGARTVSRLIEICGDPLPLFGHDRRMDVRSA